MTSSNHKSNYEFEGNMDGVTVSNPSKHVRSKVHPTESVTDFMEQRITALKENGKIRTSETYSTALHSLKRFLNGKRLCFESLDGELMEAYEAYLASKGLIPNSISFHMRILRAIYNRAVERGLTEQRRPFKHVYTGVDKTVNRAITLPEIRNIRDADLDAWPTAAFARDIFMLSFYLRGMSFIDMAYLRKADLRDDVLCYRRRKTGQLLTVKWTREMQAIIDKYPQNPTIHLLPIIVSDKKDFRRQYRSVQQKVNKGLKKVKEIIGLKTNLSAYVARHSWASIARIKGVPLAVISEGLGHDNELTTQIYLSRLDSSAIDYANELIIKLL